jgi:hypothetical protein
MITIPAVAPDMIANNIEPYEPTHPGELLKEKLECRGISQKKFADHLAQIRKSPMMHFDVHFKFS